VSTDKYLREYNERKDRRKEEELIKTEKP